MKYSNETDLSNFKKINSLSWDELKDKILIRLVNGKTIDKYGKDIAYTKYLDLEITYTVQEVKNETVLSHMLTNQEIKEMGVSLDEVQLAAFHNTGSDRKRRIFTFKESVLKDNPMFPVMSMPKGYMGVGDSGQTPGYIEDVDMESGQENVLVITNRLSAFGSSYMIIPSMLEEVYDRFNQENFYVLPISVHQVMCVRKGYADHDGQKPLYEVEDDLLCMVEGINDNGNKDWKDILSYKIYYYLGDDGKRLFPIT